MRDDIKTVTIFINLAISNI